MNIGGGGGAGVALSAAFPVAGAADGRGDRGSAGGFEDGVGSDMCSRESWQRASGGQSTPES